MQAQWNGKVIASSNNNVKVDGNAYFPLEDLDQAYFEPSSHTTECGWKGTASYSLSHQKDHMLQLVRVGQRINQPQTIQMNHDL